MRRQQSLGYDDPEGLIIYHVDESAPAATATTSTAWWTWWMPAPGSTARAAGARTWTAPTPTYAKVWGYNRGDNGDLWPGFTAVNADSSQWALPRDRTTFNDTSVPAAGDYSCGQTGLSLENIALAGVDVNLDVSFATAAGAVPANVATGGVWDFETDAAEWQFCNSYVHWDQSQAGNCAGSGGLWFGTDGWANCGGVGYGNNWNDFTWITVGVQTAGSPRVELTHRYELETGYDYAYLEVRPWGDLGDWTQLASSPAPAAAPPAPGPSPRRCWRRAIPTATASRRWTCACAWPATAAGRRGRQLLRHRLVGGPGGGDLPVPVGRGPARAGCGGRSWPRPVPNPFNPQTCCATACPRAPASVTLAVYDAAGPPGAPPGRGRSRAGWHEAVLERPHRHGRPRGQRRCTSRGSSRTGPCQTQKMVMVQ